MHKVHLNTFYVHNTYEFFRVNYDNSLQRIFSDLSVDFKEINFWVELFYDAFLSYSEKFYSWVI